MNYHFKNEICYGIIVEFETKVILHTIQYFKYFSILKAFLKVLLMFNEATVNH
jgi:hypothetical protein